MKNRNSKGPRQGQCPTCGYWFMLKGLASHIYHCRASHEVQHEPEAPQADLASKAWELVCDPCRFLWFLFLLLVINQFLSVAVQKLVFVKLDEAVRGFVAENMPVVFESLHQHKQHHGSQSDVGETDGKV